MIWLLFVLYLLMKMPVEFHFLSTVVLGFDRKLIHLTLAKGFEEVLDCLYGTMMKYVLM